MADFNLGALGLTSPVSYSDPTKSLKSTSLSNTIPSLIDTANRLSDPSIPQDVYLLGTLLTAPPATFSVTTRPAGGQLWPRGVYNK
jgi:hypothetical protein